MKKSGVDGETTRSGVQLRGSNTLGCHEKEASAVWRRTTASWDPAAGPKLAIPGAREVPILEVECRPNHIRTESAREPQETTGKRAMHDIPSNPTNSSAQRPCDKECPRKGRGKP